MASDPAAQPAPLYGPETTASLDADRDLGYPGEFPFTRGIQPTMYRGRFWTMRQYAGFGTAAETNRRYRYLLDQGQTGLSVAFDLPTQMGYDSDHPMAAGEVGRSRRGDRLPRRHGDAAGRHPAGSRLHVHDHQCHRPILLASMWRWRGRAAWRWMRSPGRSRTTS